MIVSTARRSQSGCAWRWRPVLLVPVLILGAVHLYLQQGASSQMAFEHQRVVDISTGVGQWQGPRTEAYSSLFGSWFQPTHGSWLGSRDNFPRSFVFSLPLFVLPEQVECAEIELKFAVDDRLEAAYINRHTILLPEQQHFDRLSTLRVERHLGLFQVGHNWLRLHVSNTGGRGGIFAQVDYSEASNYSEACAATSITSATVATTVFDARYWHRYRPLGWPHHRTAQESDLIP
eukprot:4081579-Prymnesium_polylepis.1